MLIIRLNLYKYLNLDMQWSEWTSWSSCEFCVNQKTRTRNCNKASTNFGGRIFSVTQSEASTCFNETCYGLYFSLLLIETFLPLYFILCECPTGWFFPHSHSIPLLIPLFWYPFSTSPKISFKKIRYRLQTFSTFYLSRVKPTKAGLSQVTCYQNYSRIEKFNRIKIRIGLVFGL